MEKGGSVVVLDSEDYNREALRQISTTTTYCTVHTNPDIIFKAQLLSLLDSGVEMGVLTLKTAQFLCVDNPLVPVCCHLPKLHKNTVPVQGRPIVAGIGSLFERLGQCIDQYLQPLVTRLPGYIKYTSTVLFHIENILW